jgi:hypothetical protein
MPSQMGALSRFAVAVASSVLWLGCGGGSTTTIIQSSSAGSEGISHDAASPSPTSFHYSGEGDQLVAAKLVVGQQSTLRWTNAGKWRDFVIESNLTDHPLLHVSSNAKSGQSIVLPGTYRQVDVYGTGRWTVDISPSQ